MSFPIFIGQSATNQEVLPTTQEMVELYIDLQGENQCSLERSQPGAGCYSSQWELAGCSLTARSEHNTEQELVSWPPGLPAACTSASPI